MDDISMLSFVAGEHFRRPCVLRPDSPRTPWRVHFSIRQTLTPHARMCVIFGFALWDRHPLMRHSS